jgi:hypothetical protein
MIEYEDNPDFKQAIERMLARTDYPEFNAIREHEDVNIFGLLCIRTDKDGEHVEGKGDPVVCRKIPAPFQVLTGGQYLLIADYYFWTHADVEQQEAKLYHAFMHIKIEEGKEEGELKFGIHQPDVRAYASEIYHYGAHTLALRDVSEALKRSAKQFAETLATKT